jgi:hypothetical protein
MAPNGHPISGQAARIIDKFGGVLALQAALKEIGVSRSRTQIYRWTQPKWNYGTNGVIPSSVLQEILEAARLQGILITKEDLYGTIGDPPPSFTRKKKP